MQYIFGAILAVALSLGSQPLKAEGVGFVSEVRLGLYGHDVGVWSDRKEDDSLAVTGELLFKAPFGPFENRFANYFFTPRPHVGAVVSVGPSTDFAYAGLTWELLRFRGIFLEFGFGGAWNNGDLQPQTRGKKGMGSRWLFHEQVSLGIDVTENLSVMASFHHVSNADLASSNGGLDHAGVRVGYSF